ncbi:MAG: efflux RND transporter permease subunit [Acidobacteria bacterium]|nr:efflux RND transporter permease subunit [Acidobacteriota bacterium]
MKRYLSFPVDHPIPVLFIAGIFVVAGLFSWWVLPVDLLPRIDVPVVNIITHEPGASPADVEQLVTRPLESALQTLPGIRRLASTSLQGTSLITVAFHFGTGINDARQLVRSRISRVIRLLPAGVIPRIEGIGTTLQQVCGYVITGADQIRLRTIADRTLVGQLSMVKGVERVEVLGGDRPAWTVALKPEKLAALKLGVNNVVSAIRRYNQVETAGVLPRFGRDLLIRGDSRFRSPEDLAKVPVSGNGIETVTLGDIASIRPGTVPRHYEITGNGRPGIALIVRKVPGADTISVVSDIDARLKALKHLLPDTAVIHKFYDQSELIREARNEVGWDLLFGIFLAMAAIILFMGWTRSSLVVGLTIPSALLAVVVLMACFGMSLNIITMTAMALAVGMIVDDAIVVAENIGRHLESGALAPDAAVAGVNEIAAPDISGTITTVAAFVPLFAAGGIAAVFLKPFAIVISFALLFSLLFSLTVVPALMGKGSWGGAGKIPGIRFLNGGMSFTLRLLDVAMASPKKTVLIFAGLIFIGLVLPFLGPIRVLPPIDEGSLLLEYVTPPGTSLRESSRIGRKLSAAVWAYPEVSFVYRRTGPAKQGLQVESVNRGELTVKLKPRSKRNRSATELLAALRKQFAGIPGIVILYHQPTRENLDESFSGLPALFGVSVFGPDLATIRDLAGKVKKILEKDPAVSTIVNHAESTTGQLTVRFDPEKTALLNVDPQAAMDTLKAAGLGVFATDVIRRNRTIRVRVTLSGNALHTPAEVKRLPVINRKGEFVPLSRIAKIFRENSPAFIHRRAGQREETLVAEVDGNLPAVARRLQKRFAEMKLPPETGVTIVGQYPILIRTVESILFAALAALLLVGGILRIQFHSLKQAVVILATIPVSLAGAMLLVGITRAGLDISVGMGMITLIGIGVNNAIVLIDAANRFSGKGVLFADALKNAVRVRFRPILLTSLTTVAALIPAALPLGGGSGIFQPFAVSVIGGLLAGTFGTLVLVPVLACAGVKSDRREVGV